jgi:hypothetical protein
MTSGLAVHPQLAILGHTRRDWRVNRVNYTAVELKMGLFHVEVDMFRNDRK